MICLLSLVMCSASNKKNLSSTPSQFDLMAHLRFIASDELKGRKPGTPEAKIAARYIVEQFRSAGLKDFEKAKDYWQPAILLKEKKGNHCGSTQKPVLCNNVVGFLKGSDADLKKEYILLVAHYDHLGVKSNPTASDTDIIYNGARDNGMGTVALIYAAKVLTKNPPARSIIFLATTGEENGLLGSAYFVKNSPISLRDIVFVLNNDGGGFNDTSLIRIGGLDRINFPDWICKGLKKQNITCLPYPKELNYLYELGDSKSFADQGIPAITISPGFNKIDDNILKYVHKVTDEADDSFDYNYLEKFCISYTQIALNIANCKKIPSWKEIVKK